MIHLILLGLNGLFNHLTWRTQCHQVHRKHRKRGTGVFHRCCHQPMCAYAASLFRCQRRRIRLGGIQPHTPDTMVATLGVPCTLNGRPCTGLIGPLYRVGPIQRLRAPRHTGFRGKNIQHSCGRRAVGPHTSPRTRHCTWGAPSAEQILGLPFGMRESIGAAALLIPVHTGHHLASV